MSSQFAPGSSSDHLQFVLIEHPSDAKGVNYRRKIRSRVTQTQHRLARERGARASQPRALPTPDRVRWLKERRRQREQDMAAAFNRQGFIEAEVARSKDDEEEEITLPSAVSGVSSERRVKAPARKRWKYSDIARTTSTSNAMVLPNVSLANAYSRGSNAVQLFALDDPDNVVGRSLSHLNLHVSSIWALYDTIVQVQSRDFEQSFASGIQSGVTHARFLHFICEDPVTLSLAILLTTRYLLATSAHRLHPVAIERALRLRGFMIQKVSAALDDPVRGISDHMLVAVLLFAVHELHYVSVEAYHIHMNGVVQMINLRGGMAEVGRTDPYMERFMIWHDANASNTAGCEPYCAKVKEPSRIERPPANEEIDLGRMKISPADD